MLAGALAFVLAQAAAGTEPALHTCGSYAAIKGATNPRVKYEARPRYPEAALAAGVVGVVRIAAIVGVDGKPGSLRLVRGLDPKHGTDKSALDAASKWRFEPGRLDGKPVPVPVCIEISLYFSGAKRREVFTKPQEVTSPPQAISGPTAAYTARAAKDGAEGTVVIEGIVEPDGTVSAFEIVRGVHPELDDAAATAFRSTKFAPAVKNGKRVPYQLGVRYDFTLPKIAGFLLARDVSSLRRTR